jgi:hypothetical protein
VAILALAQAQGHRCGTNSLVPLPARLLLGPHPSGSDAHLPARHRLSCPARQWRENHPRRARVRSRPHPHLPRLSMLPQSCLVHPCSLPSECRQYRVQLLPRLPRLPLLLPRPARRMTTLATLMISDLPAKVTPRTGSTTLVILATLHRVHPSHSKPTRPNRSKRSNHLQRPRRLSLYCKTEPKPHPQMLSAHHFSQLVHHPPPAHPRPNANLSITHLRYRS